MSDISESGTLEDLFRDGAAADEAARSGSESETPSAAELHPAYVEAGEKSRGKTTRRKKTKTKFKFENKAWMKKDFLEDFRLAATRGKELLFMNNRSMGRKFVDYPLHLPYRFLSMSGHTLIGALGFFMAATNLAKFKAEEGERVKFEDSPVFGLNMLITSANFVKNFSVSVLALAIIVGNGSHLLSWANKNVDTADRLDVIEETIEDPFEWVAQAYPREPQLNAIERMKADGNYLDIFAEIDPITHENSSDYIRAYFLQNYDASPNAVIRLEAVMSAALSGPEVNPVFSYMFSRKERAYMDGADGGRAQERLDTGGISNTRTQFQYTPSTALDVLVRQYNNGQLERGLGDYSIYPNVRVVAEGLHSGYNHYARLYSNKNTFMEIQGRDTLTESLQGLLSNPTTLGVLFGNNAQDNIARFNRAYLPEWQRISITTSETADYTAADWARTFALSYPRWQQGNYRIAAAFARAERGDLSWDTSVADYSPVGNEWDWYVNGDTSKPKTLKQAYDDFYAQGLRFAQEVMVTEESLDRVNDDSYMIYYSGPEENRDRYSLENNPARSQLGAPIVAVSQFFNEQEGWSPLAKATGNASIDIIDGAYSGFFDLAQRTDVVTPIQDMISGNDVEPIAEQADDEQPINVTEQVDLFVSSGVSEESRSALATYLIENGIPEQNARVFASSYDSNPDLANTNIGWYFQDGTNAGNWSQEQLVFAVELMRWHQENYNVSSSERTRLPSLERKLSPETRRQLEQRPNGPS
ncbi:MAG: hypothetical protein CMH32_01185 [Micavibrio sp.]|nr:hypothetical protein [Micavibrio sp.]HCK33383.1 hypothetical protein [Rhodospirillaceae bacterium]